MLLFFITILVVCYVFYWLNNFFRKALVEDLTGKARRHVLITGTDTGFGKKLALVLDRRGFIVHAGCYTQSGADSHRSSDSGTSSRLKTLLLDVTNDDSVSAARKTVENDLPPGQGLWALVNNAGIVRGAVFEFASFEDYETTMNVNFYGIVRMTNAFLPLVQMARGRVVNVVSILGRFSLSAGPYSCSKFAAEAYSDGLRRHMAPYGVKVSIIEPGFYPTYISSARNFMADIDRSWAALPDDVKISYGKDYLNKVKNTLEKTANNYPLSSGNRIHQVTDSIEHAICSLYPKARYVCGLDAHLLYRPAANFIPDWFLDYAINFIKDMRSNEVRNLKLT